MGQTGLGSYFETYLNGSLLFSDKRVLQSQYVPDTVLHRDVEINKLASVLAPSLRAERPSNLFLYGKTGSGKTVSVKYMLNELTKMAYKRNTPLRIIYVNCKLKRVADTEYRLIAQLAREFGKAVPATGLPTEEVYRIFFSAVDSSSQLLILVLDEIDQLVKKTGDEILYNLTRINEELRQSQISIIGISNDLTFVDELDPRVKSSLSEEEFTFAPYNAFQIQDILQERARTAFADGVVGDGVLAKCAAYAAREHGDVRRALELLRVDGEIAERNRFKKLELEHIDEAENKIERDRITEMVLTQPKQFQATLYAIYSSELKKMYTGDVYDIYRSLCARIGLKPLTQRRLSDIVSELDMLGLINAKVVSKGRHGRTRVVSLPAGRAMTAKVRKLLLTALEV